MEDILFEVARTPLPTILVMAGIAFMFLAIVGNFGAKVVVNPKKQRLAGLLGTVLLFGGVALYFLRAPTAPIPPPAPALVPPPAPALAPIPELTRELFIGRNWEFRHGEGDVISPNVRLNSDGTIVGVDHPNESSWALEDGILVFYHVSGVPSTRFTTVRHDHGKIILTGPLLLPGHEPVVIHVLEEL